MGVGTSSSLSHTLTSIQFLPACVTVKKAVLPRAVRCSLPSATPSSRVRLDFLLVYPTSRPAGMESPSVHVPIVPNTTHVSLSITDLSAPEIRTI